MKFRLLIAFIAISLIGQAQNDSLPERRNTIKLNLVTSMLFSNSGALSFERIIKTNQSWGFMIGYVQFPSLGQISPYISASNNHTSNYGFVVGGEYRFYLKKENKFAAPHGVYIGPYANYYLFNNVRDLVYTDPETGVVSNGSMTTSLDVLNMGFQIGYQFLVNDRWTFDMIFFGPSVSYYKLDTSVTGDIDESLLTGGLAEALQENFPLLKELIEDKAINLHGKTSSWGNGFRYQLNVGYHFGRKKKN